MGPLTIGRRSPSGLPCQAKTCQCIPCQAMPWKQCLATNQCWIFFSQIESVGKIAMSRRRQTPGRPFLSYILQERNCKKGNFSIPGVWSRNCARFCGKLWHGCRSHCSWLGKATLRTGIASFHIDSFPQMKNCSRITFLFIYIPKSWLSLFMGLQILFLDASISLWYLSH